MKRFIVVSCAMLVMTASGLALPAGSAPQANKEKAAASPADLDKLLAPVALYPDALLAQMLMSASNPGKIGALDEWLRSQTVKGTALQDAAAKSGFEDSFVALVIFPDVVHYMAQQVDWTTRLGQAFAADKTAVFDSIQRLRKKARDAGTLKSNQQQQVDTKTTSGGQQVIVIEPTNPQVVYVPQYNPQVVYVEQESSNSANAAAAGALIGFTAGIVIGAAIDNDYYYGPYGWHGGGYMYNDAWDDYYDHREDAREDWQDHREDMGDERSDRAKNAQEQRTDRTQTRNENRPESQTQRTGAQSATPQARTTGTTQESRGYSKDAASARERSGTSSDAFSGYSSGKSERAASSRGKSSRSSSRSGGGSRRR